MRGLRFAVALLLFTGATSAQRGRAPSTPARSDDEAPPKGASGASEPSRAPATSSSWESSRFETPPETSGEPGAPKGGSPQSIPRAAEPSSESPSTPTDSARIRAEGQSWRIEAPTPPLPPPDRLPSGVSSWLERQAVPCDLGGWASAGDLYYLACGESGLWVIRVQENLAGAKVPVLLYTRELGGKAIDIVEHRGQFWIRVVLTTLRPVGPAPTDPGVSVPTAPTAPRLLENPPKSPDEVTTDGQVSPGEMLPIEGRVRSVNDHRVVIDLNGDDGVSPGDRVEFFAEEDGSSTELIVGEVEEVNPLGATVRVGLNEIVAVGTKVRATDREPTLSVASPPRSGHRWAAGVFLRPFLGLDGGGGMLSEAFVERRYEKSRWMVAADPLAIGFGNTPAPHELYGLASIDLRMFEIGLGLGSTTVFDPGPYPSGTGLLLMQRVRVGASDGFHVAARTSFAVFYQELRFTAFRFALQIPASRRVALFLDLGGGATGYGMGEFGARVLMQGNGEAGSWFLRTSLGLAGTFRTTRVFDQDFISTENDSAAGPHLGIGFERRF